MKKALFVTTVSGFVPQFEMNNVKMLQEIGYEIHYASNYDNPSYGIDNKRLDGTGIIRHQIDFVRSPFAIKDNLKVYRQLMKLLTDVKYDLVHCHTPMGGVMTRLVAKRSLTRPVFYTVHGFHFFEGAPLINWLIFYPVEKYLSRFTDVLITINHEDYERAKKFHAKTIRYIPGVGIDYDKIQNVVIDRNAKKKELGISKDTSIILSAGELIKRKNYKTALKAFADAKLPDTVYLICGHGVLDENLKKYAMQLGIIDKVMFLGYRNDIYEIMRCADVFFFPSYQEGLPVALMEAMAIGLPILCSKIRGNIDLIKHNEGGYLYSPDNVAMFSQSLIKLMSNPAIRHRMCEINNKMIQKYDINSVNKIMAQLYKKYACKIME